MLNNDDQMHLEEEIQRLTTQVEQIERQRKHEYFEKSPSPFEMVKHFHKTYGLAVRDEPIDFDLENMSPEDSTLFHLRWTLMVEEWKELESAWVGEDLVEFADACCDLMYVVVGTCVSLGIPFDECFAEVQRSNMSKLGVDGKPIVREDGKILKGPDFSQPDLRSIIYGN